MSKLEKKPKLIFVVHRLERKGGMEESTFQIATHLARKGWCVEVVSFRFADWPNELPVRWHPVSGFWVRAHGLMNFWIQWRAPQILKSIQKKNPANALVITSGALLKKADLRIIQFYHQSFDSLLEQNRVTLPNPRTIFHRWYQRCLHRLNLNRERKFLHQAKTLACISNGVRKAVASDIKEIPVVAIHHAIQKRNRTNHKLSKARKTTAQTANILFVGALERKGIKKALEVLTLVNDLKWQFTVIGGGHLSHWKKYARSIGIQNRVQFLGPLRAYNFFINSDFFLFPSIYEPFGICVAEAMGAGCIPLASKECGAMELWSNRDSFLDLSFADSNQKWGQALRQLLTSEQQRKRCIEQLNKISTTYTWNVCSKKYEQTIEEIIARDNQQLSNSSPSNAKSQIPA